jgi:chromosome segregation ATPase
MSFNPLPSLTWLRWLPLLLALLFGLWLGYKWNARALDAVRAELAAIKGAESKAAHEYDATTERLKAQASEAKARHDAAVQKIESSFAGDRKQLQASLENSVGRLAQARRERSDASAELVSVREKLAVLVGDNELLRRREAELVEVEKRMKLKEQSLQCLQVQVPTEELGILNQQRGL